MPIHIFEHVLKLNNIRLTFEHVKSIFNVDEFIVIFSMTTCGPCNSLFDIIKSYDANNNNNKIYVIKINIDDDICEADSMQINMVPYILHITNAQYSCWNLTDNLLDNVNDVNRCILYVNRTSKFIDDNELNAEF